MMKVILLPGMDGTGSLFSELVQYLELEYEIISYDPIKKQGYKELIEYVSEHLGQSDPCIVIAESFSGVIAYNLLQKHENIVSVIFVASFVTPPNKALWLFKKYLPSWLTPVNMPNFAAKFLLGKMASKAAINQFKQALVSVSKQVLAHRVKEMANVRPDLQKIKIRCSYIRPLNDNIVSKECAKVIEQQCSDFAIYEVHGSHFVLQVNARESAEAINSEIRLITRRCS